MPGQAEILSSALLMARECLTEPLCSICCQVLLSYRALRCAWRMVDAPHTCVAWTRPCLTAHSSGVCSCLLSLTKFPQSTYANHVTPVLSSLEHAPTGTHLVDDVLKYIKVFLLGMFSKTSLMHIHGCPTPPESRSTAWRCPGARPLSSALRLPQRQMVLSG